MAKDSRLIGPSVLSADYLHLGQQLSDLEAAGADYIHFDVMDGRFVPNISIGLPILEAIRRGTSLPIDTHLMIVEPEKWIHAFAEAGSDSITIHVEATHHLHRLIETIRAADIRASVAFNPATPISDIEEIVPLVDQILLMTINPGFGGQTFLPETVDKLHRLRKLVDRVNSECVIQVDGGITTETIVTASAAGATSFVAGTSVFGGSDSIADNIRALRSA